MKLITYLEDKYEDNLPGWYWDSMASFFIWKTETFPFYYKWKSDRQHKANMIDKFGFVPTIGDKVNDCRGVNGIITEVDKDNPDMVVIDGVNGCSLWNCCGPVEDD